MECYLNSVECEEIDYNDYDQISYRDLKSLSDIEIKKKLKEIIIDKKDFNFIELNKRYHELKSSPDFKDKNRIDKLNKELDQKILIYDNKWYYDGMSRVTDSNLISIYDHRYTVSDFLNLGIYYGHLEKRFKIFMSKTKKLVITEMLSYKYAETIDSPEKINEILNGIFEAIKFVIEKEKENEESAISFFDNL